METRSLVLLSYLILQTLLPKEMALRKIPNVDEYMIEDQRTHRTQNYVVQRPFDNELSADIDNAEPAYITDSFDPNTRPEELPEPIVDYLNLIRNDVILLDNTVETRTRKRGNIKKFNQALPDPPCSCESVKYTKDLGMDYFPQYVETKNCSKGTCAQSYRCKEIIYFITVLKKRVNKREESQEEIPSGLDPRKWIASKEPIITGCMCARD